MTLVLAYKVIAMYVSNKENIKKISIPSKTQIKLFAKIKSIHAINTMWLNRLLWEDKPNQKLLPNLTFQYLHT